MTIHLADTAQSGPLGSAAEGNFTTISNEFMAGQIYEAVRDKVFTSANGYISQYHRLTAVKFNEINSNGRYANPNESFGYYSPTPAAGTNTLVTMPPPSGHRHHVSHCTSARAGHQGTRVLALLAVCRIGRAHKCRPGRHLRGDREECHQ